MESIVFKVKYGETLRRYIPPFGEGEKLDLDIAKLREKIDSFFGFSPDRSFNLSYVDEDGDMVALVDEDDLHDVLNQDLDPVRITVESFSKTGNKFSGTRFRSPQPDLNSISNVIKSIPEPLRESISKLSQEVVSKAASTGQLISGLVDSISKLGQSLNAESSRNEIPTQKAEIKEATNATDTQNANSGTKDSTNVNDDACSVSGPSGCNSKTIVANSGTKGSMNVNDDACGVSGPSGCNSTTNAKFHIENDSRIVDADSVEATKFNSYPAFNAINRCPFSGTPLFDSGIPNESPLNNTSYKFRGGSFTNFFHSGIQCDECRVLPITIPYYKSKLTENYNLCRICFVTLGKDDDYITVDHPVSPYPSFRRTKFHEQIPKHVYPDMIKKGGHRLDSHFVLDINILDGTVLAPSTPFTKIWRMKNIGIIPWPKGTKLVWIGGERFSSENSVEAQSIANGLAVNEEINIAVDFCAPEEAGRYLSYWRLSTPSGLRFGQRVWVIIEVDAALRSPGFGHNGLNLNLPPVDSETNDIDDINMIVGRQNKELIPEMCGTWRSFDYSIPTNQNNSIYHPLLVDENSVPNTKSRRLVISKPETTPSFLESRLSPSSPIASFAPTIEQILDNNYDIKYSSDIEVNLLLELRAMGFKNLNLNKEILRKNEYDLPKSIDDLCGAGEWDPIIEDLQ